MNAFRNRRSSLLFSCVAALGAAGAVGAVAAAGDSSSSERATGSIAVKRVISNGTPVAASSVPASLREGLGDTFRPDFNSAREVQGPGTSGRWLAIPAANDGLCFSVAGGATCATGLDIDKGRAVLTFIAPPETTPEEAAANKRALEAGEPLPASSTAAALRGAQTLYGVAPSTATRVSIVLNDGRELASGDVSKGLFVLSTNTDATGANVEFEGANGSPVARSVLLR